MKLIIIYNQILYYIKYLIIIMDKKIQIIFLFFFCLENKLKF